ncbi:hypothetical protein M3182_22070 [Mesobacillus maritimus]|uniref:hypothetical protein n=1 Tax=Mesobacillus maritimus TaxID=1643336 RepID=UPI00203EFF69|nr:hypothetical protein [Mesobacillus maritimus]MCM3588369.1 hypothetical protein [Mesobacillus maritimus]
MKQFLFIMVLMLLVGCSANATPGTPEDNASIGDQTESENASKENENESNQEETQDLFDQYQPNPQVTDDRTLKKVGQSYEDEKGEATLKGYKDVNQTYKVGPIELTVKEMKWIHLRPDYSMIDYFHVLTHDEEFDFAKVFVEIKNTSSETVNFAPIALLKTSTGETMDWEKDIYLEELNGELEGNSTKFGNLGFIINASERDHGHGEEEEHEQDHQEKSLEWIEITTSDVFDENQKKIADAQKIKIEF